MSHLFVGARLKVTDNNNDPLSGGKVFTYSAGTLIPKVAYSDAAATIPHANPIILDSNGEADVWLVGTYKILIKDANNVTLNGYPVDYIPGDSVATNELAANTGATLVGTASGDNLQEVLDQIEANAKKVTVRQCLLAGPHDTNGLTNLGGATGSAIVMTSGISTGSNALLVTSGGGFNTDGALDYIGVSTTNLVFSGLSTNGTMYMYVDITAGTGVLTPGTSTLAPVYGDGVPSPTNGQFTYAISEGIAYLGNGGTAAPFPRVYLGEVTVAGNVVTAINWYAYRRRFVSAFIATLPSVAGVVSFTHNLGTNEIESAYVELECTTADAGYSVGDRAKVNPVTDATQVFPQSYSYTSTTLTFPIVFGTPFQLINKAGGTRTGLTSASWKYRAVVKSSW